MEYLIRFVQMHEDFRTAETDALAELLGFKIRWKSYSEMSPFAIIAFEGVDDHDKAARTLIARSILGTAIYELWGCGSDYKVLHTDVRHRTQHLWPAYKDVSFRFEIDSFHGTRSHIRRREIMESFGYMEFEGPIVMSTPEHKFAIFEDSLLNAPEPHQVLFGRFVAESGRKAMTTYNLKKRSYIATTSMDAELSLVTANLAHAGPGKIAYDPFMGTGSFPLACAHFGSAVLGSDLDGRSIRGKKGRSVTGNFTQYDTSALYLGGSAADLTNSPFHARRFLDSIVCDPPYGVREGLKVLGHVKERLKTEVILQNGTPAHLQDDYIPPKRPYSFVRMLDDILDFSATRLVDGGRLAMWMPVAGAQEETDTDHSEAEKQAREEQDAQEYAIPQHPALQLVSECTQHFNKWSRRLLTYGRLRDEEVDEAALMTYTTQRLAVHEADETSTPKSADELNAFRRKFFEGFKSPLFKQFHPEEEKPS